MAGSCTHAVVDRVSFTEREQPIGESGRETAAPPLRTLFCHHSALRAELRKHVALALVGEPHHTPDHCIDCAIG
jgi:hypothetical protein